MAQKQVLAPQSQLVLALRMVAPQLSLVLALRREQILAIQIQLGLPFSRGFLFLRMSICHSSYLRMSIYPSLFLNLRQVQATQLLELVLNVLYMGLRLLHTLFQQVQLTLVTIMGQVQALPQLVAALCMKKVQATQLQPRLPFSRGFLFPRMSICHSSYLDRMSIYPSSFLNLAPQPFLLALALCMYLRCL